MPRKWNCTLFLLLAFAAGTGAAEIDIPSDGSDLDLVVPENANALVIDLSQAITDRWDLDNSANAGKGIYDPDKWAVVFKYRSVKIRKNTTVSFLNHRSRAPVVWLVSGNVEIEGTLNLNSTATIGETAEPGPGGFRGSYNTRSGRGFAGFGPGGGANKSHGAHLEVYGNSRILPLIGGSGGGRGIISFCCPSYQPGNPGGGGGGAILIASRGTIHLPGSISANGANVPPRDDAGELDLNRGYGSGGAIRLVADAIVGNGKLEAVGGNIGRIRLEARKVTGSLATIPETFRVEPDNAPQIWPTSDAPTVRVVSIAGKSISLDPNAGLEISENVDSVFRDVGKIPIVVETTNLDPSNAKVYVRILPKLGDARVLQAVAQPNSTRALATWLLEEAFPAGFATLQVRAVGQ